MKKKTFPQIEMPYGIVGPSIDDMIKVRQLLSSDDVDTVRLGMSILEGFSIHPRVMFTELALARWDDSWHDKLIEDGVLNNMPRFSFRKIQVVKPINFKLFIFGYALLETPQHGLSLYMQFCIPGRDNRRVARKIEYNRIFKHADKKIKDKVLGDITKYSNEFYYLYTRSYEENS